MRNFRVLAGLGVMFAIASFLLLWAPLPCLEAPSALAVIQNVSIPPLQLNRVPPSNEPPTAWGGLQYRWDHSGLVCTGVAGTPRSTGVVENVNGADRDQLSVQVVMQQCFKGVKPAGVLTVLGDSISARTNQEAAVYSGPPIGFVAPGRNLLFLRATNSQKLWRVTVPIAATCVPLADVTPDYLLDGSDASVRRALGEEIKSVIMQGHIRGDQFGEQPEFVAAVYAPYLLEILGKPEGLNEMARLLDVLPQPERRVIAMELLRNGDERGVGDTIALLQDESAISWQRANAARALEFATSARGRNALQTLADQKSDDDLHRVARETLVRIRRNSP